jgi:hypothetical protein
LNELACRGCRRPLLGREGCVICAPLRKNLIVLGETEEERPSLAAVSNEAVNALRAQLRDYKARLAAKDLPPTDKDRLHDRQRAVSGALSKLLDAARKIQSDGITAVERMSFKERAELFVSWFCTLPPVYRETLRRELDQNEAQMLLPAEVQ